MPITNDTYLPTYEELEVEEVPLGSAFLKAGSLHLGKHCEATNNEFMLCRNETLDPRSCLVEGKDVTKCTNNFFRMVKRTCAQELTQFATCLDKSNSRLRFADCRKTQKIFDQCMLDNLKMERPHVGYLSLVRIHDTQRPKPEEKRPDWLDHPLGKGRRPDALPDDFPRVTIGPNYLGAPKSM